MGPELGDEPRPEGRSVVALGPLPIALEECDLPEPRMSRRRLRPARVRGEALLEGVAGPADVLIEEAMDAAVREALGAPEGREGALEAAGVPHLGQGLRHRREERRQGDGPEVHGGRRHGRRRRELEGRTRDTEGDRRHGEGKVGQRELSRARRGLRERDEEADPDGGEHPAR